MTEYYLFQVMRKRDKIIMYRRVLIFLKQQLNILKKENICAYAVILGILRRYQGKGLVINEDSWTEESVLTLLQHLLLIM